MPTQYQIKKFTTHSLNSLLDKRASAAKAGAKMDQFCKWWRSQRGAKSGGISASTKQLVWALLKILPPSMERIKKERPDFYLDLIHKGEFCLYTNKTILARKMWEEDGHTFVNMQCCPKTVHNQLKRLQHPQLNIITKYERCTPSGDPHPCGSGQFRIWLNPEILEFYLLEEELGAFAPSDVQTPENGEEGPQPPETVGNVLPTKYNSNIVQELKLDNRVETVDKVLPIGNGKPSSNKVRSAESRQFSVNLGCRLFAKFTENNLHPKFTENQDLIEILFNQAKNALFNDRHFTPELKQTCQDLIHNHFQAVKNFVMTTRKILMKRYTESPTYKALPDNDKLRTKARKWMQKRLPDPDKKAFEILSRAIYLQQDNCQRRDYKPYHPKVYFSMNYGFERSIFYAKKEYKNLLSYNQKDPQLVAHNKIKTKLNSLVSSVVFTFQKLGFKSAWDLYLDSLEKMRKALLSSTLHNNQRFKYLQIFKDQLNHIFLTSN